MFQSEIGFCLQQQCTGSICEKYDLEECTCASSDGKDDRELCHVCCMRKSKICLDCVSMNLPIDRRNLVTVFFYSFSYFEIVLIFLT